MQNQNLPNQINPNQPFSAQGKWLINDRKSILRQSKSTSWQNH
jgi:hypothetical protein